MPRPLFIGANDVSYTVLKYRWPNNDSFLRRLACTMCIPLHSPRSVLVLPPRKRISGALTAGTSAQPWVLPHGCPRGKCNELGMPMLMLTCKRSRAWPRATTSLSWRRCSTLPSLSEAQPPPLLLSPGASDRSSMHLSMRPHQTPRRTLLSPPES